MKILDILINSNIYISLAAVFLTIETQVQLGNEPQWHPYLFIIFFATLFEYNLHRLITVITNKDALKDEKHSWVKNYPTSFYMLVGFSVTGFLISIIFAKKEVLLTFAPLAALTLFYSLPVSGKKKYLYRLREIPFLKIFLIAFVWSTITILLPIIQSGISFNSNHLGLIFAERFAFIFAITIPFDIRDIQADKQAGLKTIPLLMGKRKSILLANILLIIFILICTFHYIKINMVYLLIAMLLSAISTIYFVNNKGLKKFKYYHYAILDGTLFLQGLLVYVFYYINVAR